MEKKRRERQYIRWVIATQNNHMYYGYTRIIITKPRVQHVIGRSLARLNVVRARTFIQQLERKLSRGGAEKGEEDTRSGSEFQSAD